jgi:hypothetical protein
MKNRLAPIIDHRLVKDLTIGDNIRSEEMTVFEKVTKLEQDKYFEKCLRITTDKKNHFYVINKNTFVEFRRHL